MASDSGSRHIHGWALSKEQAMNQEGWDKSSWNQPDFDYVIICFAVTRASCFHPFMWLTPTYFISKFTDLLTPSFMSELAFFRLLLYPTVLWVLRRFEGVSQMNASNECLNWLIQSRILACVRPSDLSHMKESNCLSTLSLSCPMKYIRLPLMAFSTFIAELVINRIRVWSCWRSKICQINENRSETMIITFFEAKVCTWWNSKFCTFSF